MPPFKPSVKQSQDIEHDKGFEIAMHMILIDHSLDIRDREAFNKYYTMLKQLQN